MKLEHSKHYLGTKATVVYGCPIDHKNDYKKELDLETIHHLDGHKNFVVQLALKPIIGLTKDESFIKLIDEQLICGSWKFEPLEPIDAFPDNIRIVSTEGYVEIISLDGDTVEPTCSLLFWNWMIENHYDVFGLVPKGMALDLNRV